LNGEQLKCCFIGDLQRKDAVTDDRTTPGIKKIVLLFGDNKKMKDAEISRYVCSLAKHVIACMMEALVSEND
jgi:hypothetical protein